MLVPPYLLGASSSQITCRKSYKIHMMKYIQYLVNFWNYLSVYSDMHLILVQFA